MSTGAQLLLVGLQRQLLCAGRPFSPVHIERWSSHRTATLSRHVSSIGRQASAAQHLSACCAVCRLTVHHAQAHRVADVQTSTATAVRMLHVAFESLLDILELLDSQKLCGEVASSPAKTATHQPEHATHDAGLTRIAWNLLQMGALLAAPLPRISGRLYAAPQQSHLHGAICRSTSCLSGS